jgi:hypothetical protein
MAVVQEKRKEGEEEEGYHRMPENNAGKMMRGVVWWHAQVGAADANAEAQRCGPIFLTFTRRNLMARRDT